MEKMEKETIYHIKPSSSYFLFDFFFFIFIVHKYTFAATTLKRHYGTDFYKYIQNVQFCIIALFWSFKMYLFFPSS